VIKSRKIRSGGSRKFGRNEIKCTRYRMRNRRERNKLRKLKKIFRKYPNNKQVANRIKSLEKELS